MTMGSLTTSAFGIQQDELPIFTTTKEVQHLTHSEHTSDEYGNYKHPFLNAPTELQTIYYPKSGSFSTKLHQVKGMPRNINKTGERAIDRGDVRQKEFSYWEMFETLLLQKYGSSEY